MEIHPFFTILCQFDSLTQRFYSIVQNVEIILWGPLMFTANSMAIHPLVLEKLYEGQKGSLKVNFDLSVVGEKTNSPSHWESLSTQEVS